MKKLTCVFLVILMILTNINFGYARDNKHDITKDVITINGLQFDNLPYVSSEVKVDQGLKSQLFINMLEVKSDTLELQGIVSEANGKNRTISIKGNIFKPVITGLGNDRAVVLVTDNDSIYEIIHFSIELYTNKTMLIRSDKDKFVNNQIIKLY